MTPTRISLLPKQIGFQQSYILICFWPVASSRINIGWWCEAVWVTLLLFTGKQEPEDVGLVDCLRTDQLVLQTSCVSCVHND